MHALNLSHSCCLALTRSRLALFPSSTSTSEASQRSERSRASIKSGASKSVKRGSERGCMLAPSRCLAVFLSCSSHFAHLLSIVCKGRKKEWRVPIRRPHQFPVRACFAMTINNFQGQILERARIYVAQDVFAHGHLFIHCCVACLSPIQTTHILFALQRFPPRTWTYNVAYKQVID